MRRLRIASAAAVVALLTSGCWTQLGGTGNRRSYQSDPGGLTAANVATLAPVWSKTVPSGARPPVVYGGAIYVAGGPTVTALGEGGNVLWQETHTDPAGEPLAFGAPTLLDGKIHVPVTYFAAGGMYVFDRATGASTGSLVLHNIAPTPLAVGNGVVARTGGSYGSGGPVLYTITYKNKTGFVGFGDLGIPPPGTPMIAGSFVYVAAGQLLMAFDVDTCPPLPPPADTLGFCAPTWTRDVGATAGMPVSLSATSVGVPLTNGNIAVVDAQTGVLQWTAVTGSTNAQAPAVSPSGVFYTGTADGIVRGFPVDGCGSASCASVWSGNAGAVVASQPTIAGGVVYAGVNSGKVAAFTEGGCSGAPCSPVKVLDVAAGPAAVYPVVNNGALIAVASGGTVAFFKPSA